MSQMTAFDFGRTELGPAIADYLARLWSTIQYFEAERNAKILFVSRAGIRIRRALELYLETQNQSLDADMEFFWTSRLMVAKGVWRRTPALSAGLFAKELGASPLREAALSLISGPETKPGLDFPPNLETAGGTEIGHLLVNGHSALDPIRRHLDAQAELFEDYIAALFGERDCGLLVDTGWQGTAQRLLQEAYPNTDWWGAYFGRSGFSYSDRSQWNKMIGLVFEADQFDPARPETCVIEHRHMIETLFEPKGPSIEWLARGEDGGACAPDSELCLADTPDMEHEPIYCGVLDYLGNLPAGQRRSDLAESARAVWPEIAKRAVLPTLDDTSLFNNEERSADFGRDFTVPVTFPPEPRSETDTAHNRIAQAIWPAGQMAREFPREIAFALQTKAVGLDHRGLPNAIAAAGDAPSDPVFDAETAAVAVITRTMDRPMFLKRALTSVNAQTMRDYVHIVVSDGGDIETTRATIAQANVEHARVILVDNVVNRGMEAASNVAIARSKTRYVVIHDDDDSWEPTFLAETVAFLDGPKGRIYDGVITKSTYVSEEVTHEGIIIRDTKPYQEQVRTVALAEMIVGNIFAPIAFVYRRSAYDAIGGYNEAYPVLGDWDFNIRFLMRADIGMIEKPLANYHHRDRGDTQLFGNSVISGTNKHLEYSSIVRNAMLRAGAKSDNSAVLAALAGLGGHGQEQRALFAEVRQRIGVVSEQVSALPPPPAPEIKPIDGDLHDHMWVAMMVMFRTIKPIYGRPTNLVMRLVRWLVGAPKLRRILRGAVFSDRFDLFVQLLAKETHTITLDIPPPANFDEAEYLRANPDVASAVEAGNIRSPYLHYYHHGRTEGRPRPTK